MTNKELPTVFVSHGPPSLVLDDVPATEFLKGLGKRYEDVEAVLCISAHWETVKPTINSVEVNETIHDFYGFQPELYDIKYPAKGDPELAEKTRDLINNASIHCEIDRHRGLDHGAWVPMILMFPEVNMPVFQLSIQQNLSPHDHHAIGKAIEPLRHDGVLILGSGGAVHPLGYAPLAPDAKTDQWALNFDEWLNNTVVSGDEKDLINYRELSPYPERAHPYPDHLMPLLTAMGSAGSGAKGKIIHHSWYWGDMGMAAYEFDV